LFAKERVDRILLDLT